MDKNRYIAEALGVDYDIICHCWKSSEESLCHHQKAKLYHTEKGMLDMLRGLDKIGEYTPFIGWLGKGIHQMSGLIIYSKIIIQEDTSICRDKVYEFFKERTANHDQENDIPIY